MTTILDGTGWKVGKVATFKEKRSDAVKVRSMKAAAKSGAFKLISSMCDLFEAKPIYNGADRTVDIVPMNPFSEPEEGKLPDVAMGKALELHYGKNVSNVTRTLNTENLVTKLYCYGSYGDKTSGYCGIDEWHHPEYHMTVAADAGEECVFTIADQTANINYTRYFKPSMILNGTEDLIWSALDPASMSYVWDDKNKLAYRVYKEHTSDQHKTATIGDTIVVTNQFSYLMDFDYYSAIGLLTDGMIQEIADYQREMPAILANMNKAATAFSDKINDLAEVIGTVDFCKLNVSSYDVDDGYLKLNLGTKLGKKDTPNGCIYRSDYSAKKINQFKWRTTDKIKENGDPTVDAAAILYIIHTAYDPVKFDLVYLKTVYDADGNVVTDGSMTNDIRGLTLWIESDKFDNSHLSTDEIYLFGQNSINGLLGATQVMDE